MNINEKNFLSPGDVVLWSGAWGTEEYNNLIGLFLCIGAGWFAWETSMITHEQKKRRKNDT